VKRFDLVIVIAAVAVVAGGIGFAVGHASVPKTTATAAPGANGSGGSRYSGGQGGFGQNRGGMHMRAFGTRGTITAVSSNTITLTDSSGATRTVNVTSTTTYLNGTDRSSSSLSAVTPGTTILASGQTGSDGTIKATRIIINPPAPGSGGGPTSGSSGVAPSN
jgi:hypothetical protein